MTEGARAGRLDGGGLFFLAVGVLSVGAAAILVRLAAAPPLTTTWLRLFVGGVALLLVARALGRRFPRGRALRRAAIAGVLLAAHFTLWIASLSLTTVTASVVLVCLQPVFVTAIAALVFRERVTRGVLVGIATALAGAVLIAVDAGAVDGGAVDVTADSAAVGNALALGGALAIALYVLVLKRRDGDDGGDGDVLATSAVVTVTAAAVALPLCAFAGAPLTPSSTSQAGFLLLLALGPQVLGHTALNAALRRLPAPVVSGAILGEPVIASGLAYVFLDERVGPQTAIGAAITIIGLVLLVLQPSATPSSSSSSTPSSSTLAS